MLTHLSVADDSCLKSMMGDTKFKKFEEALLLDAVADPSMKPRLVVCLQRDSLIVVGTRLIGANLGGWGQETRECATAVAFNNPELIFQAFGAPDLGADPSDADEARGVLPDLYECLDTAEQVSFTVRMMSKSFETAPFTGRRLLATIPQSEVECLRTSLPAPVFAVIADAPTVTGSELRDSPPELLACISAESFSRIPAEILALGMGATSEESRACVSGLFSARGNFMELALTFFEERAEDRSPEDFLDIAEGGSGLFNCLTDEELAAFQEKYLPTMLP